jgi:hypothetical protein
LKSNIINYNTLNVDRTDVCGGDTAFGSMTGIKGLLMTTLSSS